MVAFCAAAPARACVASTSTASTTTIRNASASASASSRPIRNASSRRGARRVLRVGEARTTSIVATATPSTGGTADSGTRASRRRLRRALEAGSGVDGTVGGKAGGTRDPTVSVPANRDATPRGFVRAGGDTDETTAKTGRTGSESGVRTAVSFQTEPTANGGKSETAKDAQSDEPAKGEQPSSSSANTHHHQSRLPVQRNSHVHLGASASVPDALRKIRHGLRELVRDAVSGADTKFHSGVVRFTVAAPRNVDALEWLTNIHANSSNRKALLPAYYLSPRTPPPAVRSGDGDDTEDFGADTSRRGYGGGKQKSKAREKKIIAEPSAWRADPRGAVAAVGGAVVFTGDGGFDADVLRNVRRFLGDRSVPHDAAPRVYGAGAFDPDSTRAPEWERFGGHYFFLPTLEVVEGARCAVVACAVVWDASIMSSDGMDGDYLPIQTTKYDDDSGENAPPVTTKSHANSVTCSRDLAQAVALCADAIESALGESVGSFTKDGYEKMVTGIHKTVPPNAATLVTKTLEPDQQGWHRLVDKLLVSLRTGERHERGVSGRESLGSFQNELDSQISRNPGSEEPPSTTEYVFGETTNYARDAYMDDFATVRDGFGTDRSVREKLLDLGKAAGVEAPPSRVLRELVSFATAAGLGADVSQAWGNQSISKRVGNVKGTKGVTKQSGVSVTSDLARFARDAGSVGIGWSVDESGDEGLVDEGGGGDGDIGVCEAATDALLDTNNGREEFVSSAIRPVTDDSPTETHAPEDSCVLEKVVLARRSTLEFRERLDPLGLVSSLRARDPEAYQFALVHADGGAFVGSTPERLFSCRDGHAASEAVAGTRPRGGDEGEDAALAYEMLLSPKEHEEFAIVREEVRRALATVAKDGENGVNAELEKGVLRHVSVQHLYARLGCELRDGTTEADLLSALHPTPAVCGHPRKLALSAIRQNEPFDRGLYAGPLGWIGADSAEFCVAIRSALVEHTGDDDDNTDTGPGVCPGSDSSGTAVHVKDSSGTTASTASSTTTTMDTTATRATRTNTTKKHLPIKTVMRLYAGVGVVAAADSNAEWRELNLKTKPLESLVGSLDGVVAELTKGTTELTKGRSGTQRKHPSGIEPKTTGGTSRLATSLNPNQAWADLLIGELWRNGVSVFCVAPGSRSTPLALAAEKHPCARVVVCVDERSLAFYALGVGKGAGSSSAGACVITSSGTAVANLLPAAVEASASNAPLLLLTADRPPELRDTGANQTIDQVKIFGSFTRYSVDLAPPGDGSPARVWATAANAATRHLKGPRRGPVHINCQFRDPLGPVPFPWNQERDLRGLEGWELKTTPFSGGGGDDLDAVSMDANAVKALVKLIKSAKRGILIIAGGASDGAAAALAAADVASTLGWAVVADAASGIRTGADGATGTTGTTHSSNGQNGWSPATTGCPHVLNAFDVSLCSGEMREFFAPDVIVQLNNRVTSKRTQTALEAAALDFGARWAVVTPTEARADPGHCVSLHVTCDIAVVAGALRNALDGNSSESANHNNYQRRYRDTQNFKSCESFRDVLVAADADASRTALSVLQSLEQEEGITEMGAALLVANALPPSMGLFLGNSMPIRDVDALAGVRPGGQFLKGSRHTTTNVNFGPGAPVCANRGASGIDGVVSAAAGFAAGTQLPVTLVIGDVSFQHDANGLLLLRERPGQPPVTIVVVNNGGGGIFSFVSDLQTKLDTTVFTKLFATPPDVSRRGLCDAHRVAHAHPSTPAALRTALQAAWSEGRHSVVEVTTSRAQNLRQHRVLQSAVAATVDASLRLMLGAKRGFRVGSGGDGDSQVGSGRDVQRGWSDGDARALESSQLDRVVRNALVSKFQLPMRKVPTVVGVGTGGTGSGDTETTDLFRTGYLLEITLQCGATGVGEASPLPGLSYESHEEAGAQLAVVSGLLRDVKISPNLPLLNGAFRDWLVCECGIRDVHNLLPSVRFAVESAVLQALSNSTQRNGQRNLASSLLLGAAKRDSSGNSSDTTGSSSSTSGSTSNSLASASPDDTDIFVESNALMGSNPDTDTPETAAREAVSLVEQGFRCIKIKVGRGVGTKGAAADADRVSAIRHAVGPAVTLRCDGNGLWNLNESLTFGLRAAEFDLQYIEEPVASVENDLAAFHCTTGVPVALDESVDRAMHLAWRRYHEHDEHDSASKESSAEPQSVAQALRELFEPTFGVVALVLKPSVLGGYENCALVASAAREKGIGSVVTSAFESGVGVAHCANLAAALDLASLNAAAKARETTRTGASSEDDQGDDSYSPGSGFRVTAHTGDSSDDDQTHGETQWNSTGTLQITPHGLGTGAWLVGDVTKRDFAPMVRRIDETGAPLGVGISLRGGSATDMASDFSWRPEVVFPVSAQGESPESWGVTSFIDVITDVGVYRFFVTDSGRNGDGNDDPTNPEKEKAVLFLHGFLGDGTDWTCVVAGLLESARCVVVDLPNHGGTVFVPGPGFQRKDGMTIEAMSNAIGKLGQELFVSKKISLGGKNGAKNKSSSFPSVTLVGYSLGARIALSYAVDGDKHGGWLKHGGGVVSIGGSPGISTSDFDRADRASRDDHLATALRESGVQAFTRAWYENGLFGGLVSHPRFQGCNSPEFVRAARSANVPDAAGKLAEVLSQASPGRQQVVTVEKLLASGVRVDFITGANDKKFVKVANAIADGMRKQSGTKTSKVTSQTVPNAGHAAHLEAPEGLVLPLLRCVLENAKRSE